MEKLSSAVERQPGLSRADLLGLVGGRRAYATLALTLLVSEGYVRAESQGREKHHYHVRQYREEGDNEA